MKFELIELAHLGHFSDATVLGGPCNSKLLMSKKAVRVRSPALDVA